MKNEGGNFTNLNSGMLVATFFSLWLAVYFEYAVEDTLAYILILSFGILHGANDIKLLQRTGKAEGKKYGYFRILIYYVVFVLTVAALFFYIPAIALALFILFSAYHFGEQHWINSLGIINWQAAVFCTAYGFIVLFLLFTAHAEEVSAIIFNIASIKLTGDTYLMALGASAFIFVLLYIKLIKQYNSNLILELFYLLVFFIVFNTASLLWAFAIYFIIWHSIPSLSDQIRYMYGPFNKEHFLKYLRSSAIYWAISVIALIGLFVFVDDTSGGFLPFLFSFLAAITFPHVFVISKIYQS